MGIGLVDRVHFPNRVVDYSLDFKGRVNMDGGNRRQAGRETGGQQITIAGRGWYLPPTHLERNAHSTC